MRDLEPDVIFYSKFQKKIAEKLGQGPWQLINIETDSIAASFTAIRQLGDIFDCRAAAEEIIAENQSRLDLIARKTKRIPSGQRLRVMRLMGRDKLMTPGDDSFQNELIRAAGGIPPWLEKPGNVVVMTREEFVEFNPQVIYGSRDDESLRRHGLIFDDTIKAYFSHLSVGNVRNLIYRVIHREIDKAVKFAPLIKKPELGVYHPEADEIFDTADERTELASSGVQWFAGLALMGVIALFFWGAWRRS